MLYSHILCVYLQYHHGHSNLSTCPSHRSNKHVTFTVHVNLNDCVHSVYCYFIFYTSSRVAYKWWSYASCANRLSKVLVMMANKLKLLQQPTMQQKENRWLNVVRFGHWDFSVGQSFTRPQWKWSYLKISSNLLLLSSVLICQESLAMEV